MNIFEDKRMEPHNALMEEIWQKYWQLKKGEPNSSHFLYGRNLPFWFHNLLKYIGANYKSDVGISMECCKLIKSLIDNGYWNDDYKVIEDNGHLDLELLEKFMKRNSIDVIMKEVNKWLQDKEIEKILE